MLLPHGRAQRRPCTWCGIGYRFPWAFHEESFGLSWGRAPEIFQYDVADGGIRCGNVIKAMHLAYLRVERAAHDQPHHEFDAL